MSADPVPSPAAPTILIVDDEPVVLTALRLTLERERYHVLSCSNPQAALALLPENDVAVIISDQKMPEMPGIDFLLESRNIHPHASRILLTAVVSLPTVVEAVNKGEIFRFVAKPWLREELLATVRNAVQRNELILHNRGLQAQTQELNDRLVAANAELQRQIEALELKRQKLDSANGELAARYENSLELCRRILTAYDPILGGQAKALVEIAGKMAESGHFSPEDRRALCSAAWLCDLGLIGVPRELLRSFRRTPERLSERELAMLHHHPIYSQTLAALVDPRLDLAETIRAHHECFDGTGYPEGLEGKSIPWPARCLAVAVAFLESDRPKQATLEAIVAGSGSRFDPEAVRLFLRVSNLIQLPRQVREILLGELAPGMVLASGIYSPHGLLLVGEGQPLGPATISKILNHNDVAPIEQRLLVYT
jgi:response regulator RpfG family c-di-GMP phosphodiesterase